MRRIGWAFGIAQLVLVSGCGVFGHVDKRFIDDVATVPESVARHPELLAGPMPGFSRMTGSADMEALRSELTRRTDFRAVSGGWGMAQPAPQGTARLSGETLSHRFFYGPSAMGAPLDTRFYALHKGEGLYLLGGLIALNVQRADMVEGKPKGFFGYQATGVKAVRGSIFPMTAGKEMSFVLEGRTQGNEALSTRTTIRVLGEIDDPERRLKIGGPLFVVAIERDGLLGLTPEIAYEIDWNRHGTWHRSPSKECVVYSAALGWPLVRAYAVGKSLNTFAFDFERATVFWEAREVSRRGDAPYAETNDLPVVRDGASAGSVLDRAHPDHKQGNLAQALGRSGNTALGRFNLSMQRSSMSTLTTGQVTPQGGAREVGSFFGAVLKDSADKTKRDGATAGTNDCAQ